MPSARLRLGLEDRRLGVTAELRVRSIPCGAEDLPSPPPTAFRPPPAPRPRRPPPETIWRGRSYLGKNIGVAASRPVYECVWQ